MEPQQNQVPEQSVLPTERQAPAWPDNNPEDYPQPVAPEQAPAPAAPEAQTVAAGEQSGGATVQPIAMPAIDPASLQQAPPVQDPQAAPQVIQQNPAEANDVDVIEKEWVEQADKIVAQTQGDPYVQEEAVEALQIDYLKKRYNHDVAKPDSTG